MSRPPDFDDLVGGDLPADERERLRRVHDLLVEAGPPPELPEGLQPIPEEERGNVYPLFPKRRWAAVARRRSSTLDVPRKRATSCRSPSTRQNLARKILPSSISWRRRTAH